MIIKFTVIHNGIPIGTIMSCEADFGMFCVKNNFATVLKYDGTNMSPFEASWGKHIIVGNAARTAPDGFYYWSFATLTDGVIFNELKKDAAKTLIAAGTNEEVFKTVALVINMSAGWLTFDNKVTSIKLTAATDIIIAYLKPL